MSAQLLHMVIAQEGLTERQALADDVWNLVVEVDRLLDYEALTKAVLHTRANTL